MCICMSMLQAIKNHSRELKCEYNLITSSAFQFCYLMDMALQVHHEFLLRKTMVALGNTVAIAIHLTLKCVLPELHYHFSLRLKI